MKKTKAPGRVALLAGLMVGLLATVALGQPLVGSYTVGAAGVYPDLAAAISALTTNGVSGPTTFTVLANDTSGPWTIGPIAGQGAANPILFEGLGAADLSGGSPMLTLSGCTHVTFSGFTSTVGSTSKAVLISGTTSDCVFTGCNFTAPATTSSGGLIFSLTGGTNCRIEDSTFGGCYEAFYATLANDSTTVQRCRITGGGFWIARIEGTNFNFLNNVVTGNSNYGLSCGTSGIQTNPLNAQNLRVIHNSFDIAHTSAGSQYDILRWYTLDTNTQVLNNAFHDDLGLIMWCSGSKAPAVMDYNVLWNPNTTSLIYCGSSLTFAGWQGLGYDLNSFNADPMFLAPAAVPPDLSITAASPGVAMGTTTSVMDDIFGAPRIPPVDIGAHEFSTGNQLTVVTGGAGFGDLSLSLTLIDPLAVEGFLLLTFDTAAPLGTGPVFGIYPDTLTWMSILSPIAPGNILHFPTGFPGVFPDSTLTLPAGSLSALGGLVTDGVCVLFGTGFTYVGQSNVVRTAW